MGKLSIIVLVAVLNSSLLVAASDYKVVCYYGTWATYRHSNGKFDVENIDPFVCTHIIYTFAGLSDSSEMKSLDPYLDLPDNYGRDNFGKFIRLKKKNPKLKLIIAIGGWNEGSVKYSKMANDPTLRARFVKSAVAFVKKYKFDGLDLDWEYPAQREGKKTDKASFTRLMKELYTELNKYGLLLSTAVASAEFSASLSYDIPQLQKYIDFINVMAYDLHGPWENYVGLNSPMRALNTNASDQMTVEAAITYWLNQGADPKKIILGVPLYGHTFQLANANEISIGSDAYGAGTGGPYTGQPGFMGYNEYCELQLANKQWTEYWQEEQLAPYAVKENQWFGFDNIKSILIKTQYAVSKQLGGVMVWSIETDDFRGLCNSGKYPLLNIINKGLNDQEVTNPSTHQPITSEEPDTTEDPNITEVPIITEQPSTTKEPNTTEASITTEGQITQQPSTSVQPETTEAQGTAVTSEPTWTEESHTTEPPVESTPIIVCTEPGFYPNPEDCNTFYECIKIGDNEYYLYKHTCPEGLCFDPTYKICNWPASIQYRVLQMN